MSNSCSHLMKKQEFVQVRRTGDWSSGSKLCSIKNGWWTDTYFGKLNNEESIPNRTALICYGYYVRFRVCDYFLKNVLSGVPGPVQIVSLGCGMDSLYFRLHKDYSQKIIHFYDVDYPCVIAKKQEIISKDPILLQMSAALRYVGADLKYMDESVGKALASTRFDFEAPTIFYSECCINYLEYSESEDILRWIGQYVPRSIVLAYEQANPNDSFGRIMTDHFKKNGCPILSVHENGTIEEQLIQLNRNKFHNAWVFNVWDAFCLMEKDNPVSIPIDDSTQFDEFESLVATCLHYSVRIGFSDTITTMASVVSNVSRFDTPRHRGGDVLKVDDKRVFYCVSGMKIKGHSSIEVSNQLFVIGGQNPGSVFQSRINRIRVLKKNEGFEVISEFFREHEHLARSHAAAVYDEKLNRILIMGGRKAPKSPMGCDILQITGVSSSEGTFTQSSTSGRTPFPLWRFGATVFTENESGKSWVVLCGGKSSCGAHGISEQFRLQCLSLLDVDEHLEWTDIINDDAYPETPSPRHSHVLCACTARSSIFVVGGISKDDTTLCDDALWEGRLVHDQHNKEMKVQWSRLRQFEAIGKKIGHKVKCHQGTLYVIGGYGCDRDFTLDTIITTLNLRTNTVKHYELKLYPPRLFLPFDFSAHVLQPEGSDEEYIVIFGGGGNCFSFGSYYNTDCLLFKLPLE